MAEHVAKELMTFAVITAFCATFLIMAAADVSETDYSAIPETAENLKVQGFNQTVERQADDLGNLDGQIPKELFVLIVIPLITVGAYIAVKAITGNLPFFGG